MQATEEQKQNSSVSKKIRGRVAAALLLVALVTAIWVGQYSPRSWIEQRTTYQVNENPAGELTYIYKGKAQRIESIRPYAESSLNQDNLNFTKGAPELERDWVYIDNVSGNSNERSYALLEPKFHFGVWSLLPAFLAIALCFLLKEPLTALFSGVLAAAFMLGRFDITDAVLIPSLATENAATILLLYLWLVGGLLGIWSRTGAAQAFAETMTKHFVKGPRSAKFVSWLMGVLFFQGGTISVVLVGTIVKPVSDKENVSHEELAYIVDSTASPIASVLAFNAWPVYVQALIFVPGVSFLATEADRIAFFFRSIPFSFYGILAVLGTLLLSLGITRFAGPGIRKAAERARLTGALDAVDAKPMSAKELHASKVPANYTPHVIEFLLPLLTLLGIAIGTFIVLGTPKVNWAFGSAFMLSIGMALVKGMDLGHIISGIGDGLKGVVLASAVLMLAITIGGLSQAIGAGVYLVDQLGSSIPYWTLPVALQLITMIIAFSTGTSWGTYAVSFPLAMPLAWSVAQNASLANPEIFMAICFATVLNGSVYGDQCSPISDTTILSSMTTGCDLTDHVNTQIVPATYAAVIASILWTLSAIVLAA